MNFHQLLEFPSIYRVAQTILELGMDRILTNQLQRAMTNIPTPVRTLDVGCGPSSWLWKPAVQPIGLDFSHAYTMKFHAAGGSCVTASAAEIPFRAGSGAQHQDESLSALYFFGHSGISVGSGHEVKGAAVEVDGGNKVGFVAKTARSVLDPLNL